MLAKFLLRAPLYLRPARAFACHSVDKNDATSNLLESVTSTIKGITHINDVVEHDPNLSPEEKAKRKQFLIYRSNPAVFSHFFKGL